MHEPVFLTLHVLVNAVFESSTLLSGMVTSVIKAAESMQAELVGAAIAVGWGVEVGFSNGNMNAALTPFAVTV